MIFPFSSYSTCNGGVLGEIVAPSPRNIGIEFFSSYCARFVPLCVANFTFCTLSVQNNKNSVPIFRGRGTGEMEVPLTYIRLGRVGVVFYYHRKTVCRQSMNIGP